MATDARAVAEAIVAELRGHRLLCHRNDDCEGNVVALIARHLEERPTWGEHVKDGVAYIEPEVNRDAWATSRAIVRAWIDAYPENIWAPIRDNERDVPSDRVGAHMARHMGRELLKQFDAAQRETP